MGRLGGKAVNRIVERIARVAHRFGADTDRRNLADLDVGSVRSVLWVCSGNICRSPFTARLLATLGTEVESLSAGLHTPGGALVPDWVRGFYDQEGVAWEDHRSTPITEAMVRSSDLVVGMEEAHRTELVDRFPLASGKTWLIGEIGGLDHPELADPYLAGASETAAIYQHLTQATIHFAACLNGAAQGASQAER